MDILEHSRMVAELSDKIAEVNRRILARARAGEPTDLNDNELLEELTKLMDETSIDLSEEPNAKSAVSN